MDHSETRNILRHLTGIRHRVLSVIIRDIRILPGNTHRIEFLPIFILHKNIHIALHRYRMSRMLKFISIDLILEGLGIYGIHCRLYSTAIHRDVIQKACKRHPLESLVKGRRTVVVLRRSPDSHRIRLHISLNYSMPTHRHLQPISDSLSIRRVASKNAIVIPHRKPDFGVLGKPLS